MKIYFENNWLNIRLLDGEITFFAINWQFDEYYRGVDIIFLNFNILIYW